MEYLLECATLCVKSEVILMSNDGIHAFEKKKNRITFLLTHPWRHFFYTKLDLRVSSRLYFLWLVFHMYIFWNPGFFMRYVWVQYAKYVGMKAIFFQHKRQRGHADVSQRNRLLSWAKIVFTLEFAEYIHTITNHYETRILSNQMCYLCTKRLEEK